MQVKVIGKHHFYSNKSQKECYVLSCIKSNPIEDNGVGYETMQQFVGQRIYDTVSVDTDVNILYDNRKQVEAVVPVK